MKILVACGYGMGSSLILKLKCDKVLKKYDYKADLSHCAIGEAVSISLNYDLIMVPHNFVQNFSNAASKGIKVIGLKNLTSDAEVEEKLVEALQLK